MKRQRIEIAELQDKSALNMTLIESMLAQAISLEQTVQLHLNHCYGNDSGSISLKPNKFN